MMQRDLEGKGVKLILQDNVLAVFSEQPLQVVSSAFHNGGAIKPTRAILNIQVPRGYGEVKLHSDPEAFIREQAAKVKAEGEYVAMVTAAVVSLYGICSKREGDVGVSVIATGAGDHGNTCDHAETAGETIHAVVHDDPGTINVIVIIDGNPTLPTLVSTVITATEAKTGALHELDIRSAYSGTSATGTITDAVACAHTGRGEPTYFGGPASQLGQLVGACTREAVRQAIMNGPECSPTRSLLERLSWRQLSVQKMAAELNKAHLGMTEEELIVEISDLIALSPMAASAILAAVKMDEDMQNGLHPTELGNIDEAAKQFGERVSGCKASSKALPDVQLAAVNLPPFLKHTLLGLIRNLDKTVVY